MTRWKKRLESGKGPLYKMVAECIEQDIREGLLRPGQKLPPHRELADALEINVSTVTRGYREAEMRGLVAGTVGRGTFVASDASTGSAMDSRNPYVRDIMEMGLVTPLYGHDPDISAALGTLGTRADTGPFLRYTDPAGLPAHRETGTQWIERFGLKTDPANVVICAGLQHALSCALASLFSPGERIATEELTYPGLKSTAALHNVRLAPIAMDAHGMIPEALDTACRRNTIRGLYLTPDFHNPTTGYMPGDRRDKLAEVALRHNLLLIEDDAYALTCEKKPDPVSARMPGSSVHFSGVSKCLCAGLRVAFVSACPALHRKMVGAVLNTIWMVPPLNAELVCGWIQDGTAEKVVRAKTREAGKRVALAREILPARLVRSQPNGFYIWLKMPKGWTGMNFESRARDMGINLFCAEKFVVGDAPAPQAARISLTGASLRELQNGLEKIRDLLNGQYAAPMPML